MSAAELDKARDGGGPRNSQDSPAAGRARLASLDALRGFDMFWIIGGDALVHSFAAWQKGGLATWAGTQMTHVEWDGFHFYDLIFPLFIFISGTALPLSLHRELDNGVTRSAFITRALRRTTVLVVLGIVYNNGLFQLGLSDQRYPSVLGRIGLAYLGAAVIVVFCSVRGQVLWLAGLLLGYWAALKFIPVPGIGAGVLTVDGSLVGYVDRVILPGRLFLGNHDPEGLLSTLPAIGNALAGALCGRLLLDQHRSKERTAALLATAGLASLLLGWFWGQIFPINKNLWTSSFALVTIGWSMILLAVFYYIIDIQGWRRWAYFFTVIGANSILIYLSSHLIDFGFTVSFLFGGLLQHLDEELRAVFWWIGFVTVEWTVLWFLYRRKILLRV